MTGYSNMTKYSIGIDYGTLSARCIIVDTSDGREISTCDFVYPHGVMDVVMPDGTKLPNDWALQHPRDYLDALPVIVPGALRKAGLNADDIVGIGVDFTSCTPIPVLADGTPLCFLPEYEHNIHAYAKLWKHHGAMAQADRISRIAAERGETWLSRYGGVIGSEWMVPKILQILEEAPGIYDAAEYFIDGGDWIVWQLTGKLWRNTCSAGYKSMWSKRDGYPSEDFFAALDERMRNLTDTKLAGEVVPPGMLAGGLTEQMAALTGLNTGLPVSVAIVDGHAGIPASGISKEGEFLNLIGTSGCHFMLSREHCDVPGICGVVEDGVFPGFFCYEAGLAAVGDLYGWFVKNCVNEAYTNEATEAGMSIHQYLTSKAEKLAPGETGLVALDWWNGNRNILCDPKLTGMILGLTLATRPEDIYRALIEATAFGTRRIIDTFIESGVVPTEIFASGGISAKNPMLCQITADVLRLPVTLAGGSNGSALGAAILGAVVGGCYDDFPAAARAMGQRSDVRYFPNEEASAVYDELYAEFLDLHDLFGLGGSNVMKRLLEIRDRARH